MPVNQSSLLKYLINVYGVSSLILLYCCSACRGGNGKAAGDKIVAADSIRTDTVQRLKGLWVNKVYADTLLLTRSPRASQRVEGNTYLYFTDSTEPSVLVGLGFHEGTAWSVIRSSNKVMLYDSGEKRNMGVVATISPEEFRLGRQDFIKLKHPNRDNYDFDIVEELLFAGNYRMQNGASVSLSFDGRASGWDTIRYYVPNVDYIGPGMDVDQVELGSNKDKLTPYGFRFDMDTLFIYKLKCLIPDSLARDCDSVTLGEVAWKLVKKR
jgi:hypothetical protein